MIKSLHERVSLETCEKRLLYRQEKSQLPISKRYWKLLTKENLSGVNILKNLYVYNLPLY